MKRTTAVSLAAALALSCTCLFACSPEENSSSSLSDISYNAESLVAQHEALGSDISNLTEVSVSACTGSGCHGGGYEAVREETADMWEGIGQITDANPHEAHASNAYACESCHKLLEGPSVNMCNACHNFESPEGWENKDKTSTQYGIIEEEPLY